MNSSRFRMKSVAKYPLMAFNHGVKKFVKLLGASLFVLYFFAGCQTQMQQADHILYMALKSEPPTLDPNLAADNESFKLLDNMFEGLTEFDLDLNVHPAGAKSWKVSEDGLTYTFFLNLDCRWSDGRPVTAQHYVDSWVRLLHPKTASKYAYFLYMVKGAREFNQGETAHPESVQVKAVDEYTLEVTLTAPLSYFPMVTTFVVTHPIRKDVLERDPKAFERAESYVSNGPFTLALWKHDDRLVLKRNPYYGGKPKPKIKEVHVAIVPELVTQIALYQRGYLDYVELPPIAIRKFESLPDFTPVPLLSTYYFGFNVGHPPFNDIRWRRAFSMALDKTKIPKVLMGGELPANSFVPQGMFGYEPEIGLKFNPKKARELIWQELQSGKYPKIRLHFNSDARNLRVAEWAQEEWKQNLGIAVDIVNEEWKSYLSHLENRPPQLFRMGWGADYPDPDNFLNLFTSYSENNHTNWKNKAYDELIARAASLEDQQERKKFYALAQKILLEEETAIVPLFTYSRHYLAKPRVKPLPINPFEKVVFKMLGSEL